MLKTYSDFLAYMDETGVMAFSGKFLEGFPKLGSLTAPFQWHTGDEDTDPWQWKDRAAAEKHLAFGNIVGGHKGFISQKLYPLFYSACRPDGTIEERYRSGYVKKTVLDVYQLFESGNSLDTGDIRKQMGVTKKDGASAVDGAIVTLQKEFYITVCGNRRKVSFDGLEYGWPANTYCLVDSWAGDWLKEPLLSTAEARAKILAHCAAMDNSIDIEQVERLLFNL
jgi:hypothetical protein